MRTSGRLKGLKAWLIKELCAGREMKAPAPGNDIGKIVRQEPECYIAWSPTHLDQTGHIDRQAGNAVPSITIMPKRSYAKYTEEKRHDRMNNIMRPERLRRHLIVDLLFSVYEPGTRLPGFIDSVGERGQGLDMSLIKEGSEKGVITLLDWMDECIEKLLGARVVPGTDLYLEEDDMTYSMYTDQSFVVDARPLYYGYITASFGAYSEERANEEVNKLLL